MAHRKPWNPMEDAYKNKEFNKYEQGPGAELDDDLQPGAVASNSGATIKKKFQLCLKNIPKEMTPVAITNLCSNYGKVITVNSPSSTPFVFVICATLNDMERILTGLKNNAYGIIAEVAKERSQSENQKKYLDNAKTMNGSRNRNENDNPMNSSSSQIDMSRRSIKGPFSNPPRPGHTQKKPLVTNNDYETSKLKNVDPQKHFLIQNDMHESDRNTHRGKGDNSSATNGYKTRTGRSYYVESKETVDKIKRLSEASQGSYDAETDSYIKPSSNDINVDIGNCILCKRPANKVCERCGDYYCSYECQDRDWSKHRYICFAKPNLVTPKNNAPKLTKSLEANKQNVQNTQKFENIEKENNNPKTYDQRKIEKPQMSENGSKSNTSNSNRPDNKKTNNNLMNTEEKKPNEQKASVPMADYPKSGSLVGMTTFRTTNLVYVRSLASEDNMQYIKALNIINNDAKKNKYIQKMPERGDILLADFEGSGFYRGLVLNAESPENIKIAFIDFGNVEEKKMSDLKEISPEAIKLTRFAIPVRLKGVDDFPPTQKIKDYLNSFQDSTGKDLKILYEKNKNVDNIEVELIEIATNENINKKILEMRDIKIVKDSDVPVMHTDIEMKLLPEGQKMPLFVFDNSLIDQTGYVSCIHENEVLPIEQFNLQLKVYAEKTNEPYTPREGEMCLVKYEEDNEWYRAQCLEVVGDGHPTVFFIDYGNVTQSKIENIRKYPRDLIHPCFTSSCLINDLPEKIEENLGKRLKELLPINKKIIAGEVTPMPEEDLNTISLPDVIETLKSEKLL